MSRTLWRFLFCKLLRTHSFICGYPTSNGWMDVCEFCGHSEPEVKP